MARKLLPFKARRLADTILVATPDLQQFVRKAIYLPNPIDTDHFKPNKTNPKP